VVTLAGGLALALLPGGLRLRAFLWPPLFAVAVDAAARWTGPPAWPERAARWLGERSYSLYLVHPVGLALGLWAWSVWHGPRLAGAALMLGCTALLFLAFYRVVERRFAVRGREVGPGVPAQGLGPW
jgi:peptidoglycan/LPS O-acetylase OafA/YrhL